MLLYIIDTEEHTMSQAQIALQHLQAALAALQASPQTFAVDVTVNNLIAIIEDAEACVAEAAG
jgi:hypothetical protein